MILDYKNKTAKDVVLRETIPAKLECVSNASGRNKLIHADNLPALKTLMDDHKGSIDLVYIDPPFATNTDFTISANRSNAVSRDPKGVSAYSDKLQGSEYLEFIRKRLIFLRELLSETGSIYFHIDYKIGHYIKIIMDEVFGASNFRNDIARIKCNPKNFKRKAYGNIKDMILFYSKSKEAIWNDPSTPLTKKDINKLFKKVDKQGRRYTTIPLHAPGETVNGKTGQAWRGLKPPLGRHWRTDPAILERWDEQGLIEWSINRVPRKRIFLDEKSEKKVQDIWEFKDPQLPVYPTEKNIDLLKFVIKASSNRGDTVLDCFAGSGTTLVAAELLGRHWIGIDQSVSAVKIAKQRLESVPSSLFSQDFAFWRQEHKPGSTKNVNSFSVKQKQ